MCLSRPGNGNSFYLRTLSRPQKYNTSLLPSVCPPWWMCSAWINNARELRGGYWSELWEEIVQRDTRTCGSAAVGGGGGMGGAGGGGGGTGMAGPQTPAETHTVTMPSRTQSSLSFLWGQGRPPRLLPLLKNRKALPPEKSDTQRHRHLSPTHPLLPQLPSGRRTMAPAV